MFFSLVSVDISDGIGPVKALAKRSLWQTKT